jgi:predicted amidophosphoribosyltransferase
MYYDRIAPQWDGDNLSIFEYIPWRRRGKVNDITFLLLDFKENKPAAVNEIQSVMLQAFAGWEGKFRRAFRCKYIVSVPSSSSEYANIPCEQICAALAEQFRWLTYLPEALKRIETVPKAARAASGERPDYTTHRRTIRYTGPPLHIPTETIIMVDDILTRGATSDACRDILQQATGCKRVIGLFIGRTVSS